MKKTPAGVFYFLFNLFFLIAALRFTLMDVWINQIKLDWAGASQQEETEMVMVPGILSYFILQVHL